LLSVQDVPSGYVDDGKDTIAILLVATINLPVNAAAYFLRAQSETRGHIRLECSSVVFGGNKAVETRRVCPVLVVHVQTFGQPRPPADDQMVP
jgi:hypothetical protein